MRKNQAAQSIALAFGFVGGLGFLGYTMLGDVLAGDPARSEHVAANPAPHKQTKAVVAPIAATPLAPQPVSVSPPLAVPLGSPASPTTAPAVTSMAAGAAIAAAAGHSPASTAPAAQPKPAAPVQTVSVAAAPTPAMPRPQAVMSPPPMPLPSTTSAVIAGTPEIAPAATSAKRSHKRRSATEGRVAAARTVPAVAKAPRTRPFEPAMPAPKAPPVALAAPPIERKPAVATPANSVFASKDDMAVTISGQKAWVQVSPTRTVEAKKGDVLPNLGKILEIRGNQVVAENGTLTTN